MPSKRPLSRLDKLAEHEYPNPCPNHICADPSGLDFSSEADRNADAKANRGAFIAGGKALLQILSEPGEACGPRLFIDRFSLGGAPQGVRKGVIARFNGGHDDDFEYCDVAELLQARAVHATDAEALKAQKVSAEEALILFKNDWLKLHECLASSEARVRSLIDALEHVALYADTVGRDMRPKILGIARQAISSEVQP